MSTEEPTSVDGDWEAVGRAIRRHLASRRMQWQDLVDQSMVSDSTVREIGHNRVQRKRQPSTLSAISKALGLESDYLERVLRGDVQDSPPRDDILAALESLRAEVQLLRERIDAMESSRSR